MIDASWRSHPSMQDSDAEATLIRPTKSERMENSEAASIVLANSIRNKHYYPKSITAAIQPTNRHKPTISGQASRNGFIPLTSFGIHKNLNSFWYA